MSQTFIVPSNEAVARRSGLSGLNSQSKMVSTCPLKEKNKKNQIHLLHLMFFSPEVHIWVNSKISSIKKQLDQL